MDINRLADNIDDDPDIIKEDLYGFRVAKLGPSSTDLDKLIAAVDVSYIDWDLSNPKFIGLFKKVYSGVDVQYIDQILKNELITAAQNGVQSPDLIDKLLELTNDYVQKVEQPASAQESASQTKKRVYYDNGKTSKIIDATLIIDGAKYGCPNCWFVGSGIPRTLYYTGGWQRASWAKKPEFFDYKWDNNAKHYEVHKRCSNISTINKANVVRIV